MLAGVGPFAIEAGLIAATAPETTGAHPQRQYRQADRGHRPDAGRHGHLRGRARPSTACPAPPPRSAWPSSTRPAPRPAACCRPGGSATGSQGVEVTCIDMAMPHGDRARRRSSARPATSARPSSTPTSRFFDPPGGDPPRGRRADGPRRRRGDGDPQARPGLAPPAPAAPRRPLLHAARLPPLGRRDRWRRHRHGLRSAGQPRPGARRAAAAGLHGAWSTIEHPAGRIPIELELAPPAPRSRSCAPRSFAPPAGCSRARCSFPIRHLNPIRETHDARARRACCSPPPAPPPVAVAGRPVPRRRMPRPIRTGRSRSSCPTPPAAAPTRSPA